MARRTHIALAGFAAGLCLFSAGASAEQQVRPQAKPVTASSQTQSEEEGRARARWMIPALLKPGFAEARPQEAAKLARDLYIACSKDGQWELAYKTLKPVAEPLVKGLGVNDATNFLADLATIAGKLKRTKEQDEWLARAARLASDKSGADSEAAFRVRLDGAYVLLETDRGQAAAKSIVATLKDIETAGLADLFFDAAGQAGDAFGRKLGDDQVEPIFQLGVDSPLLKTNTGAANGFFQLKAAGYTRRHGNVRFAHDLAYGALSIFSDRFGDESPEILQANNELSLALIDMGMLAAAESMLRHSYDIAFRKMDKNDPIFLSLMTNRGTVLRGLKLPQQALAFDGYAFERRKVVLGAAHEDTVISAMGLIHDLLLLERFDEAREQIVELEKVLEAPGFNPEYRKVTGRWRIYADLRSGKRKLSRKEVLSKDATAYTGGSNPDQSLPFLELFAQRADELGLHKSADAWREHAIEVAREFLGDTIPLTFETGLRYAHGQEGFNARAAVANYRVVDSWMYDWAVTSVRIAGSLKAAYAARILGDDLLGPLANFATTNGDAAELFATVANNWKTMIGPRDRELRALRETSDDEELVKLLDSYFRASGHFREIVQVVLYSTTLEPYKRKMDDAREALNVALKARKLEPVQGLHVSDHREVGASPRPDAGDVIVDIVTIGNWGVDRGDAPLSLDYYAVISRADKGAEVVLADRVVTADAGKPGRTGETRTKLAKVLERAAADAKAIYIIPPDRLYQADFAEYPTASGKRLSEVVDVHIATSREAYAFRKKHDRPENGAGMLLAGGLVYRDDSAGAYLPGSLDEVEAIATNAVARGFKPLVLKGKEGGEARVREDAVGKSILHLSTHGFFNEDPEMKVIMMNAGFTLSDASMPKTRPIIGDEDNVVHARELLTWDLTAADLVVVSACDTAKGEPGLSSTVRGLPLTLSIAGARRTLLTVEPVEDIATKKFMVRFYENLMADGSSYSEAFIKTKRDAWAGRIDGMPPELTRAYILFEH